MMPAAPSFLTRLLFLLLVAAVASLWVRAARVAGDPNPRRRLLLATLPLLVWLVVPGILARAGTLDRWTTPAPSMVVIAMCTAFTFVMAFSPAGARLAERAPLWALVGFQVFRVPVELLLHRLHAEGVIPVQMTYLGRNFDILSGLLAVPVALVLMSGRPARALTAAWNVVGLLLLANIVGIAALSAPTPARVFLNEPANRLPGLFPYVWLPTVLVQAALFGHLVVFRALLRRAK